MASYNERAGAKLKGLRTARGMNQQQLADAMRDRGEDHWRQNTVSRVENGRQGIDVDELYDLGAILDFKPWEFMGDPSLTGAETKYEAKLSHQGRAGEDLRYLKKDMEEMRARLDEMIETVGAMASWWEDSDDDDEPDIVGRSERLKAELDEFNKSLQGDDDGQSS